MLFMHCRMIWREKKATFPVCFFFFLSFFLLICSSSKLWPPFQCNKQNPRTPVRSCHHGNTSNSNIGLELICFFHLSGPIVPSVNDWQWQQTLSPTQIMIKKKSLTIAAATAGKWHNTLLGEVKHGALYFFSIYDTTVSACDSVFILALSNT